MTDPGPAPVSGDDPHARNRLLASARALGLDVPPARADAPYAEVAAAVWRLARDQIGALDDRIDALRAERDRLRGELGA